MGVASAIIPLNAEVGISFRSIFFESLKCWLCNKQEGIYIYV